MKLVMYQLKLSESESEITQSCLTLCDPMDCSLPGSSVRGILQARILQWVAISFSRRSSQPRDRSWVSRIAGRCFTIWATREAQLKLRGLTKFIIQTVIIIINRSQEKSMQIPSFLGLIMTGLHKKYLLSGTHDKNSIIY